MWTRSRLRCFCSTISTLGGRVSGKAERRDSGTVRCQPERSEGDHAGMAPFAAPRVTFPSAVPPFRRSGALLLLLLGCGTNTADERVTVPAGTSFAAVTDSLAAHGVVSNRVWFKLLARVRRADRSVRAGVYE